MNIGDEELAPVFALGDMVTLDTPATRNRLLIVAAIRQYADGLHRPLVDYVLEGDPGCPQVRLHFLPGENAKARIVSLTLYDRLAHDAYSQLSGTNQQS